MSRVERGTVRVKLPCPRTQHNGTGQGSKPEPLALELIALTMKPPHLSQLYVSALQYLGTGQKVQGGGWAGAFRNVVFRKHKTHSFQLEENGVTFP